MWRIVIRSFIIVTLIVTGTSIGVKKFNSDAIESTIKNDTDYWG